MLAGLTVTLFVSLLVNAIVTPPGGAALCKETENGSDSPGATVNPDPNMTSAPVAPRDHGNTTRNAT